MSSIFSDMPSVIVYQDDLMITTNGTLEEHLQMLDLVLSRLHEYNLQINHKKSKFCGHEADYLGFHLTRDGILPQQKKVQAIYNIAPPTNVRQVRSFLGAINHYKQLIPQKSHLCAPLTRLTQKNVPFHWTHECQSSFDKLKQSLAYSVALAYPDFSLPFIIHTDASKYQLGSVISQEKKHQVRPIAFYSRKLTDAQTRYSIIELELLSIVETLKEFHTILYGHPIIVYTDHKNLTFDNFTTDRVKRWRLIVEFYGPEIRYIKGEHNVIADALSRLPIKPSKPSESLLDLFAIDPDDFPLAYPIISRSQQDDQPLQQLIHQHPNLYETRVLQEHPIVFYHGKIVVTPELRDPLLQWYHTQLQHPGEDRLFHSIQQHFTWKNITRDVKNLVRTCDFCQRYKRQKKNYGILPPVIHDQHPWNTVCVDLIGPWKIPNQNRSILALTCIDPCTRYLEIGLPRDKTSETVSFLFDYQWLSRFPRPLECIHDNGSEFISIEFQELLQSYGIASRVTTVRNPQANSIVERVHQVLANMLRTSNLQDNPLDTTRKIQQTLRIVQWAVNTTYHTTLQASPAQLVFGRDMIMPTTYLANWAAIQARKQNRSLRDNRRENNYRIPHEYRVGDQVLIRRSLDNLGKLQLPTEGPYTIVSIENLPINGTVVIDRGDSHETINIRHLLPYFQPNN
jgi:transposase InsO family protein